MSNLILFGFKGAGKTHVGQQLARMLQRPFIDTDARMLAVAGASDIRALYHALGEAEFRALETRVLRTLAGTERSVIALGGGAVLDPKNVEFLQSLGQLVYLAVSLETLRRRGVSLALGELEAVYRARLPMYEAIPAHRFNVELWESHGLE